MASKIPAGQPWGKIRNQRGLVSRSVIRQVVALIAERFQPEQIVLFGSYAQGHPRPASDVDLLVIMKARNEIDQALRIEESLDPPFGLDVIVRTPKNLAWRLREGDWFLREAVERGKTMYEKTDQGMGAQGRSRPRSGAKNPQSKTSPAR